MYIEE
jgi:hypothetical protein